MTASEFDASELAERFDFWGQHPDFPLEDWQYEVQNDETRLGYWSWVANQLGE